MIGQLFCHWLSRRDSTQKSFIWKLPGSNQLQPGRFDKLWRSNSKSRILRVIYQPRETVFLRDIQTQRRELKISRAAKYFWRNSRCLHLNTLSIVSIDIYPQSKQKLGSKWPEKQNRQNLCSLRPGIQNSLLFFVLTWWLINEFEKS